MPTRGQLVPTGLCSNGRMGTGLWRASGVLPGTILLLGAFAGLTIFLRLPVVLLKQLSQSLKVFLTMLATGILIRVLGKVSFAYVDRDGSACFDTPLSVQMSRMNFAKHPGYALHYEIAEAM
jgi:hypothetical protein